MTVSPTPRAACAFLFLAVTALFTGCETTGDPMEGGLFGWRESKAQERVASRESHLQAAQRQRAGAVRTGASLRERSARNRGAIDAQIARNRVTERAEDRARSERAYAREQQALREVLEKADALERDSPSAAIASRARRLRAGVERAAHAPELTHTQKAERIRELDAELDRSRSEAGL